MSEPIRVLQVFHGMDCGGAENMIMNLYRNIDRSKVQFDFLVHTRKKCFFDDEIKSLGGRIFHVPYYKVVNHFTYKKLLEIFFKKHPEIKIVHGHLGSCAHVYLDVARKSGCYAIAHSHNTLPTNKSIKNTLYRLFSLRTRKVADFYFGCGRQAGLDRFGEMIVSSDKFQVLNNAIDTKRYIFDPDTRERMRKEMELEDSFVIGHIGRFNYQKNHEFLIDIFNEISKKEPKAKLLLVGDGDLRPEIENKISRLGISDKVIMTGVRSDVPDLLQAMDCFVFPSRFEGLPVSAIEAQAADLPCLISNTITDEVIVTDNVKVLPIDDDCKSEWVEELRKIGVRNTGTNRRKEIIQSNYDIGTTVKWLEQFYATHAHK